MKASALKIKKGGLDTIVAYIVVILPLLYVLIYMVATIYHFSVQTYMNQVVKEATVMVSTFGDITVEHENYIYGKLQNVLKLTGNEGLTINYYVKRFSERDGTVGDISGPHELSYLSGDIDRDNPNRINKADIIGIQVISRKNSILDSVTSFSVFGLGDDGTEYEGGLKYTAYREEIIRNERKYDPQ